MSHSRTLCHISASVCRRNYWIWRAGEPCEVCECVNDTRELHVLCAPSCDRTVCRATFEFPVGTESENKGVLAFRQD
jgi:hypothetical protein